MFTPLDLSPDGKTVAYALQDTNRKAQTKTPRSAQDLERIGIGGMGPQDFASGPGGLPGCGYHQGRAGAILRGGFGMGYD